MADPALSILIDSAGAEAGAKRVQSALQSIQKSAADTIAAIEALNKAQKGGGKGGGIDTSAGKAAVKAHEQAEQQKTAITKREAAKRANIQSNPQLNKLKGEIGQLSAALSKMATPKISTASIQRDIKALDRELNKLAKTDLSKMGDGGAAGIKKIRDRAAELTEQLKAVQKEGVRAGNLMGGNAPGPLTKTQASQQRAEDARRRSQFASVPEGASNFVGPISPKAYQAQVAAVQAAESAKTKIFEAEAAKHTAIWDRNAREQQKHTDRLKKEAADADRYRRSQMAPASSAAFVGPMPESNTQRLQRLTTQLAPASSPNFVGPMPARASDLKNVTSEADRLKKKLEDLRKTGGPSSALKGGYQELARTFDGLTSAVNMGRAAMVAYGAVGAVREAVLMADGFMSLTQRVKTATEASGDFLDMQHALFSMAQQNGVAFRDTVGVWQNLSRAAPELGATNDDMIRLTDIVQKLGTIGGSTGDELRYALRQFGQAMSMGTLRAEEMNSLLENTPEIANAIARGMGKTAGQLRVAVLEGKVLSKDVFAALMKQGDQVDQKFSRIAPTIAQGVNRIQNALSKSLGEGSGGMTTALAKGMGVLADNMDTVIESALGLGIILAGVFGGRIAGNMAKGALDAAQGLRAQAGVMRELREETVKTATATASFARSQELAAKLELASAQSRVDTARQSQASTMIGMATAAPQDRSAAASKFNDAGRELADAQKDLEAKYVAVGVAADNSAKATEALGAAQKATTVTARAFAGVMAGLRAVIATLGGPIGAALTALSVGFALSASGADEAADAQRKFNDTLVRFRELNQQIADSGTPAGIREAAVAEIRNTLNTLDRDIANARQKLNDAKQGTGQGVGDTFVNASGKIGSGAAGVLDVLTGEQFELRKKYDAARLENEKKLTKELQAQKTLLDIEQNPKDYDDFAARHHTPKVEPVVVEDKATKKFKEITGELNRTIRAQRELNAAILTGAANAAAFRVQMQIDDEIAQIPKDMSPDRQDEIAQQIRAKAQQTQIVEQNESQMQIDDEVKGQKEVARAMGGGPVAARKAEARVSARNTANALGYIGDGSAIDQDPTGEKRKALEKSYLAQADAQTAGDFASEARGSSIGLKAEEKRFQAMQKIGIARDIEMAKIEKETELINQFGSAAGKGAQKMIEQAGAAAKMRAEGELLGMAMDAENQAGGAKKLVDTADFEGDDRNAKTAMLEKRIELEGKYGTELDANAERIIKAAGAQKEYDDQRAIKNELRDSKMDTEGLETQLSMLREKGSLDAVEIAGLQKAADLKKQYGSATSDLAKQLIEQAKAQERSNIALQQEQALNAQKRETKMAGQIGRLTIDPNIGGEERSRLIAELQMENELRAQNIDVLSETSQQRINEAGNLAQVNEYYAQHNDALAQMAMQGRDSYGMLRDAAAVGLGGIEGMLTDLITGSGSAKEAFANFAKSVGEQLIRLAIQMMIIRPLAGMLMGGLAGPAPVMAAPSASFVGPMPLVGHVGGVIGVDNLPSKPMSSVMGSLPKYHSGGIVGNEQPAILKRGEGVFTEGQMKALAPSGGAGNVTVAPNITVQAPPGGSSEDGARFGKAMSREIESTIVQVMQKQMRNGGVLRPGRGG